MCIFVLKVSFKRTNERVSKFNCIVIPSFLISYIILSLRTVSNTSRPITIDKMILPVSIDNSLVFSRTSCCMSFEY